MRADQFQPHLPLRFIDRHHLHIGIVQIDPGRKVVSFLNDKENNIIDPVPVQRRGPDGFLRRQEQSSKVFNL